MTNMGWLKLNDGNLESKCVTSNGNSNYIHRIRYGEIIYIVQNNLN